MKHGLLLEVCVDSVESALAAERGGAKRVELCSGLFEGGVTPSAGMIAAVRSKIAIGLHVMIRPRGGDFCYTVDEFAVMQQDIATAKQLGADGVVFGILDKDGKVDAKRTGVLVDSARPLKVTFHRAIDMSRNPLISLKTLITLGVDRILTSGGEQTALEGTVTIKRLVHAAEDRIVVMAGSGIREQNVRQIIARTGVREIHVSLNACKSSPMRYRNEKLSMGLVTGREYQRSGVFHDRVEKLLQAALHEEADL
jgi:copper homeostasis protein